MTNLSNPHEGMDEMGDHLDLQKKCERQHALIVQMREALADAVRHGRHPDHDWPTWLSDETDAALAAADQYLGEQA